VRRSEPAQLRRQGKGQQEIVGWNEPLHLPFQPLLTLVVLTVRAQTVAAGMRHEAVMSAAFALDLHHRAGRAAAVPDRCQRPKLLNAQPVAKLRQEVGLKIGDDLSEADHRAAALARP
jgi:hypothetical protein